MILGCLLGLGCREEAASSSEPRTFRFIEDVPEELFEPSSLLRLETTFAWSFGDPQALEEWTIVDSQARIHTAGTGLTLQPTFELSQRFPTLTREVSLDAGQIDLIDLLTGQLIDVDFNLCWAAAVEDFDDLRCVRVGRDEIRGGNVNRIRFRVGEHPLWQGQIARLRLVVEAYEGRLIFLEQLRGGAEAVDAARLAEAVGKSWLADLDGDTRSVLLQAPGLPIDRQVSLSKGASLKFHYAVPKNVEQPVVFRVSALVEDESPRQIFEETVDNPGLWRQASIDLSDFQGETLGLRLETHTAEPLDPVQGLPLWGHPEVVRSTTIAGPANVILISIDTLRADRLSVYGHERETSPNIDAWADQYGVVFETVVAPAPWTLPSHVSMFTGLNAHRHGINSFIPAPASLTMLAEILRAEGYATLAITGSGLVHPKYGLAQGFDRFTYWPEKDRKNELASQLDLALETLEAHRDRPFFLFFHTYEPHKPYHQRDAFPDAIKEASPERVADLDPSYFVTINPLPGLTEDRLLPRRYFAIRSESAADFNEKVPEELADLPAALYDVGVAFTDVHLARLFDKLEELDLASRTLVVLTSDHGEMLGEHDLAGHDSLYEENLLVPLILRLPDGLGAGQRVAEQVRTVDIMPTVLDSLGLAVPGEVDGLSLRPLIAGDKSELPGPALSYATGSFHGLSLRLGNRLKYILRDSAWPPHRGFEELYLLAEDPGEADNRAASSSETERLRDWGRRLLDEETSGLRVRFVNRGEVMHRGTLRGGMMTHSVKSIDLVCEDCVYRAGTNEVTFSMPPGETFTLSLDEIQGKTLVISLVGQHAFDRSIDLASLSAPQVIGFDGSSWRQIDSQEPGAPSATITVWWQGEANVQGTLPAEADEDLRQQLRALGYLD